MAKSTAKSVISKHWSPAFAPLEGAKIEGKFVGQIISCTGFEPYDESFIKEIIHSGGGSIGNIDIWQREQIIVVGRVGFDTNYLRRSVEIGRRFGFSFQYLSQEAFLDLCGKGVTPFYHHRDPRVRKHRGLQFLTSIGFEWPQKLYWQFLPPGEHPFPKIIEYLERSNGRGRTTVLDFERLKKVYSLNPTKTYCGEDEFYGYVAFYFEQFQKAILECPQSGNAIYIISGNWQTLSQYTKQELLDYHKNKVRRIVHKGDWFSRLEHVLTTPFSEEVQEVQEVPYWVKFLGL